MGKNYVESSLKRFLKRKIKITMGMVVAFLITGTVGYAEINEVPKPEIQYDEFFYYDADGSKVISIQDSQKGKIQNYYFNKGATFDSSNGSPHSVILSHNWGEYNENTFKIFNMGKNTEFKILQYTGNASFCIQERANLTINGGNIILENGADYYNE